MVIFLLTIVTGTLSASTDDSLDVIPGDTPEKVMANVSETPKDFFFSEDDSSSEEDESDEIEHDIVLQKMLNKTAMTSFRTGNPL